MSTSHSAAAVNGDAGSADADDGSVAVGVGNAVNLDLDDGSIVVSSTNGGTTFPTVLVASTPNDGSETVTLPSITTSTGSTAVVVGEQLGDDLYIRYSYGVFDSLGTIWVTYKIGRRLSIEASSGEEQALDLIYSVNW